MVVWGCERATETRQQRKRQLICINMSLDNAHKYVRARANTRYLACRRVWRTIQCCDEVRCYCAYVLRAHGLYCIRFSFSRVAVAARSSSSPMARFNIMMKLCTRKIRRIDAFKRHHYCQHLMACASPLTMWFVAAAAVATTLETELSERCWCHCLLGVLSVACSCSLYFSRFNFAAAKNVRPSHSARTQKGIYLLSPTSKFENRF